MHSRDLNPCPLCDERDLVMSVVDHTVCVPDQLQELGLDFCSAADMPRSPN